MKKIEDIVKIILFLIVAITFTNVQAEELPSDYGTLIIPFEKIWDDVPAAERQNVIISLYKYIGETFESASEKVLVESKTLTSADLSSTNSNIWKTDFDITDEELKSGDEFYKYAVVESAIDGFYESSHINPNVIFAEPVTQQIDGITDCSGTTKEVVTEGEEKTIIVVKQTGGKGYIIWTPDALTEKEQQMIRKTIKPQNDNLLKKNVKFYHGKIGEVEGMTFGYDSISGNYYVKFVDTSMWTYIGEGLYRKSSAESNGSSITNRKAIDLSVIKVWKDDNTLYRPSSVIVHLFKDGVEINKDKVVILNESNNWSYTFTNLEKYDGDREIEYTVTEENVDGYFPIIAKEGNLFKITNIKTTTVKVIKKWANVEGIARLANIKVVLERSTDQENWEIISTKILSSDNAINKTTWTYTWLVDDEGNFLRYDDYYRVREVEYIDSDVSFFNKYFRKKITSNDENNEWTITNTCILNNELPKTGSSKELILVLMGISLMLTPFVYVGLNYKKSKGTL